MVKSKKNNKRNPRRKLAPIDGPDGVDRWTSNGYGLILDGEPVTPIAEIRKKEKQGVDESKKG